MNAGGDLTLFWAIDGGPELIKLLVDYGVDPDARTPKDWTALPRTASKGNTDSPPRRVSTRRTCSSITARRSMEGPEALGIRSPRESFDPSAENFSRDRGSYQKEPEHP